MLSVSEPAWWGTRFSQLYNQGQAREVTPQKMVFDWISGVRMDRLLLADDKVFSGLASAGDQWTSGARTIRLAEVNAEAGTARIEVIENGKVVLDRTLGPVKNELLIEDHDARKALVFEHGDVAGFLSPWPEPFKDDKANLKIYGKTFSLNYGQDYAADPRFAVYPVGCPTGHNFGFMLVNKDEIRLKSGAAFNGPEGYFKVAVDRIDGDKVAGWHGQSRRRGCRQCRSRARAGSCDGAGHPEGCRPRHAGAHLSVDRRGKRAGPGCHRRTCRVRDGNACSGKRVRPCRRGFSRTFARHARGIRNSAAGVCGRRLRGRPAATYVINCVRK